MIPFAPPRIDERSIEAVTEVLRSGWITTGPKVKEFEEKLAEYTGVPKVKCVSSATHGLELMLRWFGVGPGDEVIIPAYTYCATGNVVLHCGAKPVLVDCGPDLNMDMAQVEAALTPNTKAIIPVDIAGLPTDHEKLFRVVMAHTTEFQAANEHQKELGRPMILSDAAHSLGAWYHNKRTGALADFTVFSFHAVKNLTTAEGGAICLNLPPGYDMDILHKELGVRTLHGQSKDAFSKTQGGSWEYDVAEAGYKANMTDILAALGLVELERYEENLARRKTIFERYEALLGKYEWAELPVHETEEKKSACHVYALRIKGITAEQRADIIDGITADQVSVNVHFKPLPLLTLYKDMGYSMDNYPVANDSWEREITLPVYYQLTDDQVDTVARTVISNVERVLG